MRIVKMVWITTPLIVLWTFVNLYYLLQVHSIVIEFILISFFFFFFCQELLTEVNDVTAIVNIVRIFISLLESVHNVEETFPFRSFDVKNLRVFEIEGSKVPKKLYFSPLWQHIFLMWFIIDAEEKRWRRGAKEEKFVLKRVVGNTWLKEIPFLLTEDFKVVELFCF